MGYCMEQMEEGSFRIAAEKKADALEAVKALAGKGPLSETGKPGENGRYSWVETASFASADSLEEALAAWRWTASPDMLTGDITEIDFVGEKLGDDMTLFEALAPYVDAGSFIQMMGEDGEAWRWYFNGKTVEEIPGTLVFAGSESGGNT